MSFFAYHFNLCLVQQHDSLYEERTNPMKLFVSAFINPFIGVLTALILISFVLDVVLAEPGEQDWTTIIIISTMVVFSAILRFVQELKAGRSSDASLKMVKIPVMWWSP